MKRFAMLLGLVLSFLLAECGAQVYAQVRGEALYELMGKERLTTTTGERRVHWLPDGSGYYTSVDDSTTGVTNFFRVDPRSQKKSPLFAARDQNVLSTEYGKITGKEVKGLPFSALEFVQDGGAIKFTVDKRDFLYTFASKSLRELQRPEIKPQPGSKDLMRNMAASQLWNGTYSPDFKYFAYVKDYDLYLTETETGAEKRLTEGGNEKLLNGRPDWVYPEEFEQLDAYWWSPDSRLIAYYQYDESAVHQYPLVHDLQADAELELESYPTAGAPNPTARLFVVDINTGKRVPIATNSSSEVYIVRPGWRRDSSELIFMRMNRHQNELELLAADPQTGKTRRILYEQEECFINLPEDFTLLKDGQHFIWPSERSGWLHLYLYDLQGKLVRQLTSGEWPVGRLIAVDEKGQWVYFTGFKTLGLETHFFRVKLDGSKMAQMTTAPGSHFISMDPTGKYYTDYFSSFTVPPTMDIYSANGKKLSNLMTTNTEKLDALRLEAPELVSVKAADGVTDLHGLLFKPADFDPHKSYPLIVSVYGGPHTKMVRDSYQMSGYEHRLAQLGFMVWKMDNRGLQQRGKKFESATYLQLGRIDLADQTAGVQQITARPYVDGARVGIYGHSYGGYMTCLALLKEPEVFHVGVAGAPVTDWRNYDTIYTERYMRTPQENAEGYDLGSTLPYAKNLLGNLLIIYGSADNNVHPGNAIQLTDALVKAQKKFDVMVYPDQRHGIGGPAGRHYGQLRIDYLRRHLLTPAAAKNR